MKKSIIFTDLDGTLLDHATYSCLPAYPALQLVREKNIPLVVCSSKTGKEIEHYRRLLEAILTSRSSSTVVTPKQINSVRLFAARVLTYPKGCLSASAVTAARGKQSLFDGDREPKA